MKKVYILVLGVLVSLGVEAQSDKIKSTKKIESPFSTVGKPIVLKNPPVDMGKMKGVNFTQKISNTGKFPKGTKIPAKIDSQNKKSVKIESVNSPKL